MLSTELQDAIADDGAQEIENAEIDDEQGFVETNVIEQGVASTSSQPPMKTHSDVAFHSPVREKILGTPFATDSSRFEYPFPNPSSDPILSSSISPLPVPAPAPLPTTHSYPVNGLSSSPTAVTSFSPLFSSSFPASFPTYTLTHPKMRATPPPIPPSLKKRQRWSLTLPILRRRNSQPNESTVVPEEETRLDTSPPNNSQISVRKS